MLNQNQKAIELKPGMIDLWLMDPEQLKGHELLTRYSSLMNEQEQARQQRYRFEQDRHDALVTRALVRTVLSAYTAADFWVAPNQWQFSKGEKGKPELVNPPLPLRFNLSHTTGLIVCGVTLVADLGIDVEYIKRKVSHIKVAEYKFSALECAELKSLPTARQKARFFDYWTLKESYIKAVGGGLSIPLDQFSFHIEGDNDIEMSFDPKLNENPAHWHNWLLQGSADHRIAVSVKEEKKIDHQLRCFQTIPLLDHWPVNLPLNLT